MIQIKETQKYNINPNSIIGNAFETAYTRYAEVQPVTPPDLAVPVSTGLSMILLCILFLLTGDEYKDEKILWYALSLVCLFVMGRSIYKYIVQKNKYKNAAGKPSTVKAKREKFFSMFKKNDEELPETISAGDMLRLVSPIIGKQNDQVFNNALREISEDLSRINNPSLLICKLVNPCGEIFTQAKRRLYFKDEGNGKYVLFDSDWSKPKGEITFNDSDVISFGEYAKYSGLNTSGGKIRSDSVILEIQDDTNHIYLEFQSGTLPQLKKVLPGKKEK